MTTTELTSPPRAPGPPDETLPLIGAVPVYGPPVVVVAGPWGESRWGAA